MFAKSSLMRRLSDSKVNSRKALIRARTVLKMEVFDLDINMRWYLIGGKMLLS